MAHEISIVKNTKGTRIECSCGYVGPMVGEGEIEKWREYHRLAVIIRGEIEKERRDERRRRYPYEVHSLAE